MALRDTARDPLNWLLLVLALAFGYYVIAVPYWTKFYLKESPQRLTLREYMENPSHPRPFMLHALGTPPSSVEIVLTDLRVAHIDTDAILLESTVAAAGAEEPGMEDEAMAEEGDEAPVPAAGEAGETAPERGPSTGAAAGGQEGAGEEPGLAAGGMVAEGAPPLDQILIAGENMDLLELSLGQEVELQIHDLWESPLGWVPAQPELERDTEEYYTKEEIDELELVKIHADGNLVTTSYKETGELRFATGNFPPGEVFTLEQLSNDTTYIQTANRLGGSGLIDLYDIHIVGKATQDRNPYFIVEDDEGRRGRIFFNPRLLGEWYWVRPRLEDQKIFARGTLRPMSPPQLRQLESEANVQVVMDGNDVLSEDGTAVFNLENPAETAGGMGQGGGTGTTP